MEPLIEVLLTEVRHTLRLNVAEALQTLTNPSETIAFALVMDDSNPHVRYVVAPTLEQQDAPEILPYLKMLTLYESDSVLEIAREGVKRLMSRQIEGRDK